MKATATNLWNKIEELQAQFAVDRELANTFGKLVEEQSDWDSFRINPLRFAARHGLDATQTVNLFIYGTKAGLFELDWNLICPMCGCVEHTYDSLNQIAMGDTFYCTLCDEHIETELDNFVEVSFNLSPQVRELDIHPFADQDSYFRYFFSQNFVRPQAFVDYLLHQSIKQFAPLPPNGSVTLTINGKPGEHYRLISLDKHSVATVQFTDEVRTALHTVDLQAGSNGLRPTEIEIGSGPLEIRVTNQDAQETAFALMLSDWEHLSSLLNCEAGNSLMEVKPFLSGKMLLNNQKFRESFLVENLPNGMNLKISNLTILFTDLKGSTSLYEKTGDVEAYRLVQDHFRLLTDVVSQHDGATVKTMGDAIMASFSTPGDAVTAALAMVREMKALNDSIVDLDTTLELKIGLHTGPALAVKANETIDFFGQTVNLAARVQGQAEAGEVWISEAIQSDPAVQDVLAANGCRAEKHTVTLKGVNSPSTIYRCVTA
ncbi:adenylate/guanylate cyclase domain-containing protein [Tumebacillus flagellatus]|uniref:Guanylate cyclase domain-containing protein n=1 Tax=Tumebacillus flagellatus TaxID=1157490 RepID=A0A074LT29_9BACL|nr:adenylate/guanylate cyclase domain-containing protein [Tumebacillus flagellatus]KEO83023.1 hypothetical protein EL26_12090 [Tumebacillus flagellatus]